MRSSYGVYLYFYPKIVFFWKKLKFCNISNKFSNFWAYYIAKIVLYHLVHVKIDWISTLVCHLNDFHIFVFSDYFLSWQTIVLSPLPVKFWWGLVENCKFFISKFTIFKRVFQNLKIFQKSLKFECAKQGAFSEGKSGKMHFFEKADFFNFFWVKGTQRSEILSRSFSYLRRGVKSAFFGAKSAKNWKKRPLLKWL